MDNGWIILSALQPETISHRIVPAGSDSFWEDAADDGETEKE